MTYSTLITALQLQEHLDHNNWVIVDCRFSLADTEAGRNDYFKSHIPNAIYAHLDRDLSAPIVLQKTGRHPLPSIEKTVELFSSWGIDSETQVVVYDDKGGGIAARLWWMLQYLGHEKVAALDGGWQHWTAMNYPLSAEVPIPIHRHFVAQPQEDRLVNRQFVEGMIEGKKECGVLIDSRAAERYRGEVEPIDFKAGHIPSAVNLPFSENLGLDGLFLSKEQLKQRFEKVKADTPIEEMVFYCGSGVTACHNLLALKHAGLGEGKLYVGSWSEWINYH